jgi:phosphohistidine phosphatase SixA
LFKRTESGELQFIARLTPGQWEALALEDEAERLRVAAAIREAQTRPLAVAQPGGLPSKDAPSEAAVSLPKLSLALLDELRRGGLVLHMRHAVADRGQDANFDVVDDWQKHCILQRNLGTKGLAEAKKVGEALRALRIPIGEVITSEFCRAQDTAKEMGLAVDRALPEFNLQVSQKPVPDAAKKRIEWLGKPPPEGKNRLFVSHSHPKSNSTDQPIEKSQTAEVVVYRTRLDGPPVAIASIGVADWAPFLNRAPAQ